MKKGFTLIELMIVIIIIGVLATIGIVQYQAAVEKSRGAEAKAVLGYLRGACAPIWMDTQGTLGCDVGALGIGAATTNVPNACRSTNYFTYSISTPGAAGVGTISFRGTRCTAGGKTPQGTVPAGTVTLNVDFAGGADTWASTGGF
jgi:prepilin-type N-terminal cleavage/methylation domain-containing protein